VNLALINVGLTTPTLVTVTPVPFTATVVAPRRKFVPVSVTATVTPLDALFGVIEASVGSGTAVNVTGLPANDPAAVAVTALGPAPRTQFPTVAIPDASVVWIAPLRVPLPDDIANVTDTPASGLPFLSRTRTDGNGDAEPPVEPVTVVAEFAEMVRKVSPWRNAVMSSIAVGEIPVNEIPPIANPASELLKIAES
jgi:hypothetical protein